jgi:hypothetical protein
MCDYSLQDIASRPATVGDELVSTSFKDMLTRGFASPKEPAVAVCLMPGTEVAFAAAPVEYAGVLPFLPYRRIENRVARFRQVNLKYPTAHHDALEFPDGKIVLVTALKEGQRLTVLQLPAGATVIDLQPHVHKDEAALAREIPVAPVR